MSRVNTSQPSNCKSWPDNWSSWWVSDEDLCAVLRGRQQFLSLKRNKRISFDIASQLKYRKRVNQSVSYKRVGRRPVRNSQCAARQGRFASAFFRSTIGSDANAFRCTPSSAPRARTCSSCRPAAPTSIQSSEPLPRSKTSCELPSHTTSRPNGKRSANSSTSFPKTNAPTISKTQVMFPYKNNLL